MNLFVSLLSLSAPAQCPCFALAKVPALPIVITVLRKDKIPALANHCPGKWDQK